MQMRINSHYGKKVILNCMKRRIKLTEQLIYGLVENINRFSSPVSFVRDCYDVSPIYGK